MLDRLQHDPLMDLLHIKLLCGKRDITSQCLPSPWVSAFVAFSPSLTPSLSTGLKHDSPAEAALSGRGFKQIVKYHLALSMP